MVVNAEPAGTGAFGGRGEAADIAKVVVRPDDGHVVRHAQAGVVIVEHFLVGTKNLTDTRGITVAEILGEQIALVGENLFKRGDTFALGLWSDDGAVVNAAHADGEKAFTIGAFLDALFPVGEDAGAIRKIVEELRFGLPLVDVVAEHRLGMT
jgi:hypothetical protein